MNFPRREELRATFAGIAPLYDRARPSYPESLFDDALDIAGLVPPSDLCEIGPGTGAATRFFAERGFRVVAVELEEGMAHAARENLSRWPGVEVIAADFDVYELPRKFDAVLAFSAFHWLDPARRYERAAWALREGGILVVADARVVVPEGADPFFTEAETDYEAVLGDHARLSGAPALASLRSEMEESGLFAHIAERQYEWDVPHTAAEYVDLLDTLPWHRALDPLERRDLYGRIRRRIGERHSDKLPVTFRAVLDVGRVAVLP